MGYKILEPEKKAGSGYKIIEPEPKEEKTSLYDAAYPRLTNVEKTGKGNVALATGLDIMSMPGRLVAGGVGTLAELLGQAHGMKQTAQPKVKLSPEQMQQLKSGGKTKLTQQQFAGTGKEFEPEVPSFKKNFAATGGGLAESIARDPANIIPGLGVAGKAKFIPTVAKGLMRGAESAAVHQSENVAKGEDIDALSAALETSLSGAIPGAGMALKGTIQKIGKGIVSANIRPGQIGRKAGFKIENLFKHKLDKASLEKMQTVTEESLDKLQTALKTFEQKNGSIQVNVGKAYTETINELLGNKVKTLGENSQIAKALDDLTNELSSSVPQTATDFATAQAVKRAAQKQGSWVQGALKKQWSEDLSAKEKVYNVFSAKVKNEINQALKTANPKLAKDLQAINKSFEEIIPIEQSIVRRRVIDESNYPIKPFETAVLGVGGTLYGLAQDVGEGKSPWTRLKNAAIYGVGSAALGQGVRKIISSPTTGRALYHSPEIASKLKLPGAGQMTRSATFNPNYHNNLYSILTGQQ